MNHATPLEPAGSGKDGSGGHGVRNALIRATANRRAVLFTCVLAAVLVYLNSLGNGFAYDDYWIVQSRELVHGLGRLPELLRAEYWPEAFHAGLYRPLTLLTFALDWAIWNGSAFGFHLLNVLLHAGVTLLVTILLLEFFPVRAALAGGLVFAIHPVHTEAVANVVGRGELLTALFVLVATVAYLRAGRSGRIRWPTAALIAACYVLAMLSKELGVVLPGLLLLVDLVLAARGRIGGWRGYLRSRLPLFGTLVVFLGLYLLLRWQVLGVALESVPDRAFAPDDSFPTRLFTMARVWPRYLELFMFPLDLSADYSPAVILPVKSITPLGAAGFLLVLGLVGLAVAAYRTAPEFAFAVGWAAIAILPVSNLIVVAEIVLAERTLYLPSIAVALVAGLAVARARAPVRRWLGLGLAIWIAGFSVRTITRNPVWHDTDAVFENLRRTHPESSRLLWGLGHQYYRDGEWALAKEWFRKSLEIWPYHAPYLAEFAVYLKDHGELAEAERMAAAAAELDPDYPDHHSLLAVIRLQAGDPEGALEAVRAGSDRVGEVPIFHALRADGYAALGDYTAAARAQARFLELGPEKDEGAAWLRLARFRAAAGDTASALTAIERARSAPGAPVAKLDSLKAALGAAGGGESP